MASKKGPPAGISAATNPTNSELSESVDVYGDPGDV